MLPRIELSVVTLASVNNRKNLNYNTRQAGFTMNQAKQFENLKKDADIPNYDTVFNNFMKMLMLSVIVAFTSKLQALLSILLLSKRVNHTALLSTR